MSIQEHISEGLVAPTTKALTKPRHGRKGLTQETESVRDITFPEWTNIFALPCSVMGR
jgi:hypothetical protein